MEQRYKEKYEQALERARNLYKDAIDMGENLRAKQCEIIFPELAESEDEKVRKALLELVHDTTGDELWIDYNVHKEEALDWLERQVEQKFEMKTAEESLGISSDEYNKIVDECLFGEQKTKENKGNVGGISPNWSEEDKNFMYDTLSNLTELKDGYGEGYGNVGKCIDWVKSIKDRVQPQNYWKPNDEQIRALKHAFNDGSITFAEMEILATLYEGLKSII